MKITILVSSSIIGISTALQALAAPILYIPLGAAGEVQLVDAASDKVIGRIGELGNTHGIAITPDGKTIIAGSYSVSKPGTDAIPERPKAVSEAEHESHHGNSTTVKKETSGISFVSIVDVSSRKVLRRIAVDGAVHHVAVSPVDNIAVTTHPAKGSISVIDLDSFAVVKTLKTGKMPNYAAFTHSSKRLYVSNTGENTVSEIDPKTWSVLRTIETGLSPEHLVLSLNDQMLYVNNVGDGTVSAISLSDWKLVKKYIVGKSPHGIELSDDDKTLYVSDKNERKLIAINLETDSRRELPLTPIPYHVSAVRGTGKLYVSSRAQTTLWVVDQKSLKLLNSLKIGGVGHQIAVSYK